MSPNDEHEREHDADGALPEESSGNIHSDEKKVSDDFFIVGIGASAGGLEAVSALLKRVTFDGAAFVVVQHLSPNQTSMLTELLGRASRLEVVTAENGMLVRVNVVYVTPPNAELSLLNGVLQLLTPQPVTRPPMPIDAFFRSLADDRGAKAMAVVMSGTGTDGTFGLAAIKAAGGITFVQEPSTAKFDGMPRSAIKSGRADFCLSPEGIADEILKVSTHPYLRQSSTSPEFRDELGHLVVLIRSAFGVDLSHYKPNMIERRIQRRMALHKIERVTDYVRFCQTNENELSTLHKDLLINVTSFFRDRDAFDSLRTEVFPRILEGKKEHDTVRVWIPGCSSGEEAYSIAMCLIEALDDRQQNLKVQLFGTDLDGEAVQQARRGIYPPNIVADVSAERLRKFFVQSEDGRYQISPRIRDMVVFSVQNVSKDPPLSKLDLISCRNLLIYLQPSIQKKVLRIFHYALNSSGFLFLGTSETVGDASDLFSLFDRKNKFFSAKRVALSASALDLGVGLPGDHPSQDVVPLATSRPMLSIAQLADRRILEQHAPPGVIINENLEVLYYRGQTDRFLQQPTGPATQNVLRLARPNLHPHLKNVIEKVLLANESATSTAIIRADGSGLETLTLVAQPLLEPATKARCVLILFKETEPKPNQDERAHGTDSTSSESSNQETGVLRQELALTKEYLQSTIEELDRSNADLKSMNEELQSTNEELQSTNEELETSKEEIQSTNEELITLNEELRNGMKELGESNDDLHNLLLGVDRAVIIVGTDLRIRRFTRTAEKLLNLMTTDVGRATSLLDGFLGGFGIDKKISKAIETISTIEEEVQATDRRWYRVRMTPYKTLDQTVRGAVISIVDIELTKRRADLTTAVDEYAAEVLSAIQQPLMIVNAELTIIWVNDAYYRVFQVLPAETVGTRMQKIGTGEWSSTDLQKRVHDVLRSGVPFRDHELLFNFQEIGSKRLRISGSRIRNVANETPLVLLSIAGDFGSSADRNAP